jgi:hypothetical protein
MSHRPFHIWIVYYAILLHLTWGVILLFAFSASQALAVQYLYRVVPDNRALGLLLILASIAAIIALFTRHVRVFLALIIPQQFFLFVSAGGSIYYLLHKFTTSDLSEVLRQMGIHGHTLVVLVSLFGPIISKATDWKVVLVSQAPTIIAAICHVGGVLQHYRRGPWLSSPA